MRTTGIPDWKILLLQYMRLYQGGTKLNITKEVKRRTIQTNNYTAQQLKDLIPQEEIDSIMVLVEKSRCKYDWCTKEVGKHTYIDRLTGDEIRFHK